MNLIIPALLIAVALYVLLSPRMTDDDAHHRVSSTGYAPLGGAIGFYDGFFGPGTGTFFTTSLVALRGYGLTKATALTKLFNFTSNVASVLLFALGGQMLWLLGPVHGGRRDARRLSRLATPRCASARSLIRPLLVIISLGLTARLLWSYFAG